MSRDQRSPGSDSTSRVPAAARTVRRDCCVRCPWQRPSSRHTPFRDQARFPPPSLPSAPAPDDGRASRWFRAAAQCWMVPCVSPASCLADWRRPWSARSCHRCCAWCHAAARQRSRRLAAAGRDAAAWCRLRDRETHSRCARVPHRRATNAVPMRPWHRTAAQAHRRDRRTTHSAA